MSEAVVSAGQLPAVRARGRRISVIIGLCFLVAFGAVVLAVFGDVIAPQDPRALDLVNVSAKPSGENWLGTDQLGRDVFSRLIVGARAAVVGPLVVALGSMLFGSILGLLAGYRGGKVDSVIMRWVDLMLAIPGLLVIIVVAGALGGGYWLAVALLILLTTPFDTRVVRGATLEQTPRPYVEAAKTLGVPDSKIMLFHIWPNVLPLVVANTFLVFAATLVGLAGLSFLGVGSAPGTPDWGLMLAEGRTLLFANPVASLAPGAMIVVVATAVNLIGDWSYEWLSSRGATR